MKRADIVLGTEYCETGPLVYGKEPQVHARRIRFTSKEPACWVLRGVVEEKPLITPARNLSGQVIATTRKVIKQTSREIQPVASLSADVFSYNGARSSPAGTKVRYLEQQPEKGALPCERFNHQTEVWEPGLTTPASVHRTWAEYEAAQGRRQERVRELDRPRQAAQDRIDALGIAWVSRVSARGDGAVVIWIEGADVDRFLDWVESKEPKPKKKAERVMSTEEVDALLLSKD